MRIKALADLVTCFSTIFPLLSTPALANGAPLSGPVVYENLAVYFVHGAAATEAVPLTLQEALANGSVKVRETGNVNELTVENLGSEAVFIQAGDIVKGGRQDRVLSVDLVLRPRSGAVSIAAFCVEAGRWTGRGAEDAMQFSSSVSAMPSHDAMLAMKSATTASAGPAIRTGNGQAKIWATVRETQERLAGAVGAPVIAPASPSSLQLSLESERLKAAQAAYIAALQDAGESGGDIVGYVFAINGKIKGADVYPSNALFRKMWRKLLIANVTEAVGEKNTGASPPAVKDVQAFLAEAETGTESERAMNADVKLATRDHDKSVYAETRRADGSWVHRNYLGK